MTPHPLDPLTADEIRRAVAIVRRDRDVGERWRFASIELREPSKDVVRTWGAGDDCERVARVVCFNRDDSKAYRAVVSLTGDAVLSWAHEPDGQPNMTMDEMHDCDVAMRQEPRVIEALARRGITDMDHVLVEAWAYGAHLLPEPYSDRRLGWADVWNRSRGPGSNPYAHPVTGLHLVVDLNNAGAAGGRGHRRDRRADGDGGVHPEPGARTAAARRRQAAGDHPALGAVV